MFITYKYSSIDKFFYKISKTISLKKKKKVQVEDTFHINGGL